jgi:hypothetical protein
MLMHGLSACCFSCHEYKLRRGRAHAYAHAAALHLLPQGVELMQSCDPREPFECFSVESHFGQAMSAFVCAGAHAHRVM